MANLAIKGHPTRGKEVIEILEMLGGENTIKYDGSYTRCYYFLDDTLICSTYGRPHLQCYTLEEFLEKFPYKVGDKVLYKYSNTTYFIRKMFWENDKILYELSDEVYSDGGSLPDTLIFDVDVVQLQPYKEEAMDKANKAVFDTNAQCCDIMNHLIKEETMEETIKIDIPKGYEFAGVDNDNQQVVFEKIACQYPKTYEECCKVLGCKADDFFTEFGYNGCDVEISEYEDKVDDLLQNFRKLKYCRDAYWKIAGEQMGLGKPWEPDFIHAIYTCTIICRSNKIVKDAGFDSDNRVLAFPTEEMRDAFYENFKDLIIECKELL